MKRQIIPDVISGEQDLFCMPPHVTAEQAAVAMADRHVAAVLIVEDDRLAGILTERDLVFRVIAKGLQPRDVILSEIMTRDPISAAPEDSAASALNEMRNGHFRHLPVVKGDQIMGIVSIRDLYEAMAASMEEELKSAETLIYGEQYGGLSA